MIEGSNFKLLWKDMLSDCCLELKSARIIPQITHIRVILTSMSFLRTLQCFQWNFPLQIVAIVLSNRWTFYQMILSHTLDRGLN